MRLLKRFRKKPFCNDVHFLLIGVLILLLSIKYPVFYIGLFLYMVFLCFRTKLLLPVLILLSIFLLRIQLHEVVTTIPLPSTMEARVMDVIDENKYIVWYKGRKIQIQEYSHSNAPGDILELSFTEGEIAEKSYSADFDYKAYLDSKGISAIGKGKTLDKRSGPSISYFKYMYLSYLKEQLSESSYSYVSAMVFADNVLEDSIKDSYSMLGISHILAVSGLHILFLFRILSFLCYKLFHYYKKRIPLLIVGIFVVSIGCPDSAMRAFLFLLLGELNKKGEVSYTKLDILSISCLGMLLVNPYRLFGTGFLLSYFVSFILIFASELTSSKYKLFSLYKTYFFIFFATFPIVISISNQWSLFSLLFSPILSLVVTFFILPLSYILALFPILDFMLQYVYQFLNIYLTQLASYSPTLRFPSITVYPAVLYYVLFFGVIYSCYQKKGRILSFLSLCLFFIASLSLRYINPYTKVTFIDCGQGDSIYIELGHGKGNLLIDAYHSYDYLKTLGIYSIDYMILTHSDSDHMGDYEEILKEFHVGAIYYPSFDTKCKTMLEGTNAIGIEGGYCFYLEDIPIYCRGPISKNKEVNSNSLVLQMNIEGITYLFAGDMTKEEEKEVCSIYGTKLKSDILKVGHHGSDTSSSDLFLSYVNPSYSIISVAKTNTYHLPTDSVIKRLEETSTILMTKDCGNITFLHKENHLRLSIYRESMIK